MEALAELEVSRAINPASVMRARFSPGLVALPASGGMLARFEHISAVPAPSGTPGYSISRIRAINALIDRLNLLGEQNPYEEAADARGEAAQVALERMSESLRALEARRGSSGYMPGYSMSAASEGLVFSLSA